MTIATRENIERILIVLAALIWTPPLCMLIQLALYGRVM